MAAPWLCSHFHMVLGDAMHYDVQVNFFSSFVAAVRISSYSPNMAHHMLFLCYNSCTNQWILAIFRHQNWITKLHILKWTFAKYSVLETIAEKHLKTVHAWTEKKRLATKRVLSEKFWLRQWLWNGFVVYEPKIIIIIIIIKAHSRQQ